LFKIFILQFDLPDLVIQLIKALVKMAQRFLPYGGWKFKGGILVPDRFEKESDLPVRLVEIADDHRESKRYGKKKQEIPGVRVFPQQVSANKTSPKNETGDYQGGECDTFIAHIFSFFCTEWYVKYPGFLP
jgi:hypothetical protein